MAGKGKRGRPSKGPGHQEEFMILERRMRIARLYCQGKTLLEISQEVDISLPTVSKDLQAVRRFWLSNIAVDMDERVAELLAKNDVLEKEAWEGWQRSCQDAETISRVREKGIKILPPSKKGKPPTSKMMVTAEKLEKVTKGQAGDPRFLSIIGECIDRRAKYLGVDDNTQQVNNVYLDFSSLLPKEHSTTTTDIIEQRIANAGEIENAGLNQHQHQQPISGPANVIPQTDQQPTAQQIIENGHPCDQSHNQPHDRLPIGLKELLHVDEEDEIEEGVEEE